MQKKKNKEKVEIILQYVFYFVAMLAGIIMGLMYVDKSNSDERNVNYVNCHPPVKHDTISIHDTIYKERTVVRWKIKRCCCCCSRDHFGCERLKKDTVNLQ